MIDGKNIYISLRNANGTFYPIACDVSCTIDLSRDVIAVTGPGDSLWRRVIPGNRIIGSVSGNGLITFDKHVSLYSLQMQLIAGTLVSMVCDIPAENGNVTYKFGGYITKLSATGALRSAGSFTYQIEIDGPMSLLSTVQVDGEEIGFQNLLAVNETNLLDVGSHRNLII